MSPTPVAACRLFVGTRTRLAGSVVCAATILLMIAHLNTKPHFVHCEVNSPAPPSSPSPQQLLLNSRAPKLSLEDIKRVCGDKKFPLTHVDQVSQVLAVVARESKLCPNRFLPALHELQPIVESDPDEMCDQLVIDRMRAYHFRFIQPMRSKSKRPTPTEREEFEIVTGQLHPEPRTYTINLDKYKQPLIAPIAIRHFFLAFALQVSALCKRQLLANLKQDTERFITDDDYEVLQIFNNGESAKESGFMSKEMDQVDFDNVLYMPQLEGKLKESEGQEMVHLKASIRMDSVLYRLIDLCHSKLKPIYDVLLMPVIKLGKLGYDYLGDRLTKEELQELRGPEVRSWLALVSTCELFNNLIVVEGEDGALIGAKSAAELAKEKEDSTSIDSEEDEEETESDSEVEAQYEYDEEDEEDEKGPNSEGAAEVVTDDEFEELTRSKRHEMSSPIVYTASRRFQLERELWITNVTQLDLELSRKRGNKNPFGFRGVLRRCKHNVKRLFGKLNPNKYAHYRRNAAYYAGTLNFFSSIGNIIAIAGTNYFLIAAVEGW